MTHHCMLHASRPSSLSALALALSLSAAVSLKSGVAAAQTAPPATSASSPASPPAVSTPSGDAPRLATLDTVKLKDGSIYRGEILELVANDHVDLRLSTGEVRRFPMRDVTFAGASAERAPAPSPPPAPLSTAMRVEFESDTPDTEVLQKDGESVGVGYVFAGRASGVVALRTTQFKRICGAPCTSTLEPGTYRLAMSKGDRAPAQDEEPITIAGPSHVTAKYTDNVGIRIAGWAIVGASVIASSVMIVEGFNTSQTCTEATQFDAGSCASAPDTGLIIGGLVVAGVGTLVGALLARVHDGVSFSVTPWSSGALPSRGVAVEHGRATPEGLSLRVEF